VRTYEDYDEYYNGELTLVNKKIGEKAEEFVEAIEKIFNQHPLYLESGYRVEDVILVVQSCLASLQK